MFSAAVIAGTRLRLWNTKSDAITTKQRALSFGQRGQIGVTEADLPRVDAVEAGHDVHQGRLARPGGTHDRGEASTLDDERGSVERSNSGVTAAVRLGDIDRGGGSLTSDGRLQQRRHQALLRLRGAAGPVSRRRSASVARTRSIMMKGDMISLLTEVNEPSGQERASPAALFTH
jgi:hypothetical protein